MAKTDKNDPAIVFGNMLRVERRRAGLTQNAIADLIHSTQAYVSRAERGLENPPLLTLARFAEAVGCRFNFSFEKLKNIR